MPVDRKNVDDSRSGAKISVGELVARLSRFDGPPEQFLTGLLALQCHLASAAGGAILRHGGGGKPEVVAVFPTLEPGQAPPFWVAQALEMAVEAAGTATGVIRPLHGTNDLYGQPAQRHLVMLPIRGGSGVRGVGAFLMDGGDSQATAAGRERLELTMSLLSLYEMRLTLQRRQVDFKRLRTSMEVLAAVNEHERFTAAAMTMCNEMASKWQVDRVSLGFLKGRYVHLKAMSHTEKFSRKMKLVQDIEAGMEECLDQDIEVVFPSGPGATFVNRSAGELSARHGPVAVLSLPIRRNGEPVAVVTMEHSSDQPFTPEEIEVARLTCDLCTARLVGLHTRDRWVGARVAAGARKMAAFVLGPKHTWIKLAALAVIGAVLFLTLVSGAWRAEGSFVFEAAAQRSVSAPFEGYVEEVFEIPADGKVKKDRKLAQLETIKLDSELIEARTELVRARITQTTALAGGKQSEADSAKAQAEKANARIKELERQVREATIRAPIDGTVVSPDLSRQGRFHVDLGQAMFEVAPLDTLRAELAIGEDEIADVIEAHERAAKAGRDLRGYLAASSKPSMRVGFTVDRINPVAEVVDNRNVFKVRVKLDEYDESWMRPGMAGVAKIDLGRKRYVWLWSRKIVNWARMKLWI